VQLRVTERSCFRAITTLLASECVSLARVVRLTEGGLVIYRAEKDHCRRFPGPASRDLRGGPKRNFQVFSALDFLAEVTQHIPDKGEHVYPVRASTCSLLRLVLTRATWYPQETQTIRPSRIVTGWLAVRAAGPLQGEKSSFCERISCGSRVARAQSHNGGNMISRTTSTDRQSRRKKPPHVAGQVEATDDFRYR
jgi:hypothetical protein